MNSIRNTGTSDTGNHIYRTAVIACFIVSAVLLCLFILSDRSYSFDMSYAEYNPDSMVVNCFNLRQGSFTIFFDYTSDHDTVIRIQADNDKSFDVPLSAAETHAEMPFSLSHPTDRFKITLPLSEAGDITVSGIGLSSGRLPVYTDKLFYSLIFFFAGAGLAVCRKKWEGMNEESQKTVLFLVALMVLVNIPYYQKALGFTADIRAHMQRIEGIMRGLMDRQYPVVISPNLMNEFGEISFLYPDLFLYPFGILRVLGVSMLTAYRLCMLCVNAATVLVSYAAFRLMCRDRLTPLLATLIITFEPYRLYNMLGRGSGAGNAIASVFLPLVIAGVYLILNGDRRWWVLSLGMTGVAESHVLTLVLLLVTLFFTGLASVKELLRDNKYVLLIKAIVLALVMNAGFLVIFMKCYFTDWNSAALEWSDFADGTFGLSEAFTNTWSLFELILLAVSLYFLIRTKNRTGIKYRLSVIMVTEGLVLYVMTLRIFPWAALIRMSGIFDRITTMLQVPQRVYAISSVLLICSIAMLTGNEAMDKAISLKKLRRSEGIIGVLLAGMILFGTIYAFADYYSAAPLMPDEVYGDHNSLPLKDYIPSGVDDAAWSADAGYVSDEELVESVAYSKSGTHIDYTYIAHDNGTYAVMPLLYYEWYRAKDESGSPVNVKKSENGRVSVELVGDGMEHEVHIYYDMGLIYSVIYILSLLFSFAVILTIIRRRMWRLNG
ncbi:MAG: hypothetical protein J5966_04730 [Lachnospiraceae bacterium]|nr:hypothetical protein [Lachnospiraceae bacterium]